MWLHAIVYFLHVFNKIVTFKRHFTRPTWKNFAEHKEMKEMLVWLREHLVYITERVSR